MKQKSNAYRQRAFLNPISTGEPSFVFAVADSSEGGKKPHGNYVLTLADCKRIIELEFSLASPRIRRQSLAKIDLLAGIVNRFRDVVYSEAALIDQNRKNK